MSKRLLVLTVLLACGGPLAQAGGPDPEPVVSQRLIPREVTAVLSNIGSYATLPAKRAELRAWVAAQGYLPSDALYTYYLNDPPPGGVAPARCEVRLPVVWGDADLPKPARDGPRLVHTDALLMLSRAREGVQHVAADVRGLAARARALDFAPLRGHSVHRHLTLPHVARQRIELGVVVVRRVRADVGIYVSAGAHPNAVRAAAAATIAAGHSIAPLAAAEINADLGKRVRCLLMPGGWAADYKRDLAATGAKHIEQFVEQGGGYVGICAGAFFAFSEVHWEGAKLRYPLGLVDGHAEGPLELIAPWPQHALAPLRIIKGGAITKGLEGNRSVFYLGGPVLRLSRTGAQRARVLARYREGEGPAIVSVKRSRGRVFLSGVHLEYDLTSDRDDLIWPESEGKLKDKESDWDLFQRGLRWAVGKSK